MTKSEKLRRRVIWHLRHVWRFDGGGSSWTSFKELAKELKENVSSVKREVRRMSKEEYGSRLTYSFLVDNEGKLHGSGYTLSPAWEKHIPGREEDPRDDEF